MVRQAELFQGESALPNGLVYVPQFLCEAEEQALLDGAFPVGASRRFSRRRVGARDAASR